MVRLFFALPCPASTRESVIAWRDTHLQALKRQWVPAPNLHITLAFVGAVNESDMESLLTLGDRIQQSPFALTLNRIGEFGRGKYVWLGPSETPASLTALTHALTARLSEHGFPIDQRPYQPHLTVARQAPSIALPEAPDGIDMPVTAFALYESIPVTGGVRYDALKQWPLQP